MAKNFMIASYQHVEAQHVKFFGGYELSKFPKCPVLADSEASPGKVSGLESCFHVDSHCFSHKIVFNGSHPFVAQSSFKLHFSSQRWRFQL